MNEEKSCCARKKHTHAHNKIHKIIGRILFAIPLGIFGVTHFLSPEMIATMVPSYMPFPIFWAYFTGVAMVLAAIAILARKFTHLAGTLLALMLLLFVLMVHLPSLLAGDQMALMLALKDLMIAGGAFYMAGTCHKHGAKEVETSKN